MIPYGSPLSALAVIMPTLTFWLTLVAIAIVSADRERIFDERASAPAPDSFDEWTDPSREEFDNKELQRLQLWIESRRLAERMKEAAGAAAVAAARADGLYSGTLMNSKDFETASAVVRGGGQFSPSSESVERVDEEEKIQKSAVHDDEGQTDARGGYPSVDDDPPFALKPDDPGFSDEQPARKIENLEDTRGNVKIFDDSTTETSGEEDFRSRLPVIQVPLRNHNALTPLTFIAIVAACSAVGVIAIVLLGVCSYKMQKKAKAAADVEYPAYGVTGPSKDVSPGSADRRLAHSAHMYHYQHQKQQIIAMERASNEQCGSTSEPESDEDNEEGDYTVYECPGLASTREMEVKNPLFLDEPTPVSPARQPSNASATSHTSPSHLQELPK